MRLVRRRVYEVKTRGLSGFSGNPTQRTTWARPKELTEARKFGNERNKVMGKKYFSFNKTGKSKIKTYVRFGKGRNTDIW